ncbi:hypothetical protein JXA80_00170 [bacterium]|nr:hypothetical protein [candidate division CSSED10-310 bacterium]
MSRTHILTTTLKTRDAVAATAEYTLVHELACSDLRRIERKDCWQVELADIPGETAGETMNRLARDTRVFVNPNKHVYEILTPDSLETHRIGPGLFRVPVIVGNREDRKGETACRTLAGLYGMGRHVVHVASGVLWLLDLAADDIVVARERARMITETRSRREGLLANPHSDTITVF